MNLLALGSEDGQVLRWPGAAVAEPVRCPGVELRRLAGSKEELGRSEHQANSTPQDIRPFISVVRLQPRLARVACGNGVVEHLYRADCPYRNEVARPFSGQPGRAFDNRGARSVGRVRGINLAISISCVLSCVILTPPARARPS